MTTAPSPHTPLDVSPPGSVTWPDGPPGAAAGPPGANERRWLGIPVLAPDRISPGLRQGAGFAAFFGTLWLVQGLLPIVGVLAVIGLVPGLSIALLLVRSRRPAPGGTTSRRGRTAASRYLAWVTAAQVVLSVVGGVALQLLAPADTVLPFVILTVGAYLLGIAPALGTPHVAATGVILCVLSTVAAGVFAETDRTVFLGLSAGIVFVVKGFVDLHVADRADVR